MTRPRLLWRVIVWDSCPGFEGEIHDLDAWPETIAETVGRAWAERYPTDLVTLVPADAG